MYKGLLLYILVLFLGLIHIGSIIAFTHYFQWNYFFLSIILWQFLGTIGISVCYHRGITHRSYKSNNVIKIFHLCVALLAGQAGPITWATVHRIHHKYSDTEKDIHSPIAGFWQAHLGWIFQREKRKTMPEFKNPDKDLASDPTLRIFEKAFYPGLLLSLFLLYYLGGLAVFLWFGCFRLCLTLHSSWAVNSFGHILGYRNFETKDNSKNSKLLALISGGEGFHNNHHKRPNSPKMSYHPGEFDLGYLYLKVLHYLKLVEFNNKAQTL